MRGPLSSTSLTQLSQFLPNLAFGISRVRRQAIVNFMTPLLQGEINLTITMLTRHYILFTM